MTTHIHSESDLDNAIAALVARDPRWRAVFARTGRPPLRRRAGGFAGLAQIIVSQQVSVASAAAIHGRLVAIADPFDHAAVLRARRDRLVRVGLSGAKIKTLKAIARAIDGNEIELHYQPVVDMGNGRLRGVEALARWTHRERGAVAPDVFIPLAEQSGMIVPLGRKRWRARAPTCRACGRGSTRRTCSRGRCRPPSSSSATAAGRRCATRSLSARAPPAGSRASPPGR